MNLISTIAPVPADLGLPTTFAAWRDVQLRSIDDAYAAFTAGLADAATSQYFVSQLIACGGGKSLANMAQIVIAGRGAYLTATNALLEQLLAEFASIGAVVIKGRGNYTCALGASDSVTCEDGRHLGCRAHKDGACPYSNALDAAKASPIVLTNYDFWLAIHKHGEGLGVFDILVCDEASAAVDKICDAMAIEITRIDLSRANLTALGPDASIADWRVWAVSAAAGVDAMLTVSAARLKAIGRGDEDVMRGSSRAIQDHKALAALKSNLEALTTVADDWVADVAWHIDAGDHRSAVGWRFDPLWPAERTGDLLYLNIPRVLATSATMTPKTCDLLGMPEEARMYREYPAVFDPRRSPLYWLTSNARVGKNMSGDDEDAWARTLDQLLRHWPDYKGLVHAVSYTWAKLLFKLSTERRRLLYHASWNTQAKLDEFRAKPEGEGAPWLLSPAVTAGYDFAHGAARINVIAKIPMKDGRSKIMKARIKADPVYSDWLTAEDVMQAVGRVMREFDDWGVSVVIDDHWEWWYWKAKKRKLFAAWFVQLYDAGGKTARLPELPKGCS